MSVYQSQGKELSQQALYQQKLRQGVYNSPSKPSVGVASSASDTAALLAASTDLHVKPSYERLQAAPEAHTAALAVKMGKSKKEDDDEEYVVEDSDVGIPQGYNRGSVYKQAQSNSTSTMTSRSTPEKAVGKHGLPLKSSRSSTLNIGKISELADKNSSLLLNKRFNPEQDYRSGIQTKPAEFLSQEEEDMAAKSAGRSLTMKHGAGYTDSVSSQKRTQTFQANEVMDATLLAAASAKAQERLQSLNLVKQQDVRDQAQLYSKAFAAAQKKSDERMKAHNAGMVDLGGGLSLPISEVDKMANLIVQPVLKDLDQKATAQREFDQAQVTKQAELKTLHTKSKKDDEERKRAAKAELAKEKEARVQANEERKKVEDVEFSQYQKERNQEIETKKQELRDLQAKHAEEKEALLKEKKENEERVSEEETELINGRKEELEKMQKEKDEILKPTLDQLKVETEKLDKLTETKEELAKEVESAEKLKEEHEAKIKELKEKLELTETKIEDTTQEHEEYVSKRQQSDKELKELQKSSEKTLKEVEDSHKALDGEISSLKKEKEENIATKASHKKEIHLQIEEKVKGEHEINKHLPEHMQEHIDEDKIRDTGSLFSVEEKEAKKEVKKEVNSKKSKTHEDDEYDEHFEDAQSENGVAPVTQVTKDMLKPLKVNPPADVLGKKKGFRARIKEAFSTSEPDSKESSSNSTGAKASSGNTHKKDAKSDKGDSFDNFEDLSISQSKKKKAGLFKEEI